MKIKLTFCGLICTFVINIINNIYGGGIDSKGDVPGWVSIITGILYFFRHLFSLMHGKHAENTNNSSHLGELVKQGCESLTTFLFLMYQFPI